MSTFALVGALVGGVYEVPQSLSGVSLYPAWMAFTVASELGPSYWLEPSIHTRFVGELINVMPAGTVPLQPGPAMRKLPPPVPVVLRCREDVRPSRQDSHLVVDAVRVGHREDGGSLDKSSQALENKTSTGGAGTAVNDGVNGMDGVLN